MPSPPETVAFSTSGWRAVFARHVRLLVPVCVIGAVLVVIAPLPPVLMDLLLAANITLSVVILLTTTQVKNPLQFSVFPSLLLGTTLARLVLNIATTRLILTRAADHGTSAAGGVIASFGDFVTSGSAVVGLILFLILVAIQFLVITHGATRISEVAARFALDGMPGRQMAIDADLASGALTAEQAEQQRRAVARQADFYGTMDGASKFVRGDAVAGLVITGVNIVGGLVIGVAQNGMSVPEAARVFTTLTIGDGLVSQLPALLIAIAAGLLITRPSTDSNLSEDAVTQTFAYPVVLYSAAAMLGCLAFTGLPLVPLLSLALACGFVGWSLENHAGPTSIEVIDESATAVSNEAQSSTTSLFVPGEAEPLALELGLGLLSLTRTTDADGLVPQIGALRQRLATELGFVVPKSRVRDNLMLGFREFNITLDGHTIATGSIEDTEAGVVQILEQLEGAIRRHGHTLLSRQQVHQLLDHMRAMSPQIVDDVIPEPLKVGQLHQVLSSLLCESVSIRNLECILSTLADAAHDTRDIEQLTNTVRTALGRGICSPYCRPDGSLPAIVLDPMFEASLADGYANEVDDELVDELGRIQFSMTNTRYQPVLVCRGDVRIRLRDTLSRPFPELPVFGRHEIPMDIELDVVAEIGQSLLMTSSSAA